MFNCLVNSYLIYCFHIILIKDFILLIINSVNVCVVLAFIIKFVIGF